MKTKFLLLLFIISCTIFSQDIELIGVPGGRVVDIMVHPNLNYKVITSTYEGSLFYSNDGFGIKKIIDLNYGSDNGGADIWIDYESPENIYSSISLFSFKSTDFGTTWEIINVNTSWRTKFLINPLESNSVYMTREGKEVWKSFDRGINWFLLKSFNSNLKCFAIAKTDTSSLYAAADNTLYKSTNSGADWFRTLDSTVPISIYQLEVNPYNKNSIYFYDFTNKLWKSEDGGQTYRDIMSGDWTAGFIVNPLDTMVLYSYNSTTGMMKTTNEGQTWTEINNGLLGYANCLEIDPNNPEVLYAGINSLGVFKTTNGGENWFPTNLSYSGSIREIVVHRSGKIEVGQYGWGIMKTTNQGKDWIHPVFVPNDYQNIVSLDITYHPQDSSKGFLAAYLALGKTTDGGDSWYSTFQLPGISGVAYYPARPETLFAASADAPLGSSWLHQSTDGGETWNVILDFQYFNEGVNEFYFDPINENRIYARGHTKIIKSTDAGATWEDKINGISPQGGPLIENISDFTLKKNEPNILYCTQRAAYVYMGHLYKSTNGGENWFRIDSALYTLDPMVSVSCILLDEEKRGRIYAGLLDHGQPYTTGYTNGGLYLTEDDGKNWRKVFGGEVTKIAADYNTPRNIYFATKFGLMTFLDTLTVTSVEDQKNNTPSEYALEQNYPNPFNPATIIRYQIPSDGLVTLRIYDILGREITTLVNEEKPAGTYEVEFNANSYTRGGGILPSGVYFYQLRAGNFSETKKMILLK